MGESIDLIARQSSVFNILDDGNDDIDDAIQLSSAHQLILNCIWLNIKVSNFSKLK